MSNKTSKIVLALFVTITLAASLSFAQDQDTKDQKQSGVNKGMSCCSGMDSTKTDMSNGHMDMDHNKTMKDDSETMMEDKNLIVREGVIDLNAIDENGDGKVYQDQMCWNVVSDNSGECPQCGMKLKEVSLDDARTNLEKNGFKVK